MNTEFNIGTCPVCGQGLLLIAKAFESNTLLVICDDCETQWSTPVAALSGIDPIHDEFATVENATLEEIETAGWRNYIQNVE